MPGWDLISLNLLSPMVLCFFLGGVIKLVKSDLRFPEQLYTSLSIYLLLAIGMKGGAALRETPFADVAAPALGTLVLGVTTPLLCILILRKIGRFSLIDSAAMGAHYGSVSAVTFIASMAFLIAQNIAYEGFMPSLVALLEVPAIIVALVIAKRGDKSSNNWKEVLHEILAGQSIVLLIGGMLVGFAGGEKGFAQVEPFFVVPFKGILCLFLLEMGMVAAARLKGIKQAGPFIIGFAILMPILLGAFGVFVGSVTGLSLGGCTVLGAMSASASYIAAPAAVRLALPKANPGLYLTASLGITFPFNLSVGIPLYYFFAKLLVK